MKLERNEVITISMFLFFTLVLTSPLYLRTSHPIGYIESNSMYPSYQKGDLVVIYGKKSEKIEVNEVILFEIEEVPNPVLHRVIQIKENNTGIFFRTKGDNNSYEDPWLVPEENVLGVAILRIPLLGYVFLYLPLFVLRIITIGVATALFLSLIKDMIKKE